MESERTRRLINAGLRRPASPEPLTDIRRELEAARVAVSCAAIEGSGAAYDRHLAEACAHLDTAKHAISAALIRSGRAA